MKHPVRQIETSQSFAASINSNYRGENDKVKAVFGPHGFTAHVGRGHLLPHPEPTSQRRGRSDTLLAELRHEVNQVPAKVLGLPILLGSLTLAGYFIPEPSRDVVPSNHYWAIVLPAAITYFGFSVALFRKFYPKFISGIKPSAQEVSVWQGKHKEQL